MINRFLRMALLLAVIGLIAGCGAGGQESDGDGSEVSTNENTDGKLSGNEIRITISKNNGSEYIAEKEIEIEDGATLMNVLQKNFYVKTAEDGQFITAIERVPSKEDEQKAWLFEVNGEQADAGAADYELSPGDKVTFDYRNIE